MMMAAVVIIAAGFVFPDPFRMPVEGAGNSSFDRRSFWFFPWGKSVTHKGVDIFAQAGTPVRASVSGIVLFTGEWGRGGKVVFVLAPKWRIHYYAHLKETMISRCVFVGYVDVIGTVGNTGNAAGKPSHLHYAVISLFPRPWKNDSRPQGWRRMWYVDPTPLLTKV